MRSTAEIGTRLRSTNSPPVPASPLAATADGATRFPSIRTKVSMLRRAICEPAVRRGAGDVGVLNANVVAALDLRDRFPQHIHDIGIHTGCLNARNIDYLDRAAPSLRPQPPECTSR